MTDKSDKEIKSVDDQKSPRENTAALFSEKISRRSFGKLLGAQTLLASTVTLSGCLGGGSDSSDSDDTPTDTGTQPLTRAAFVATVSDYFDWVHSSEYNDEAKAVQKTFVDVIIGTTFTVAKV